MTEDVNGSQVDGNSVPIAPSVGILGVFGHLNYTPWYALAEYVDNSLQSYLSNKESLLGTDPGYVLRVDIDYDRSAGGSIVIEDNAAGIARRDFARAFRAAEIPPDRSGLSEFGMGMKSASIWFAREWEVRTTSVGDPNEYTVKFNMEEVIRHELNSLHVVQTDVSRSAHYTRVELRTLNQRMVGRTLGKVREHLREMYRDFLRRGELILTVAGQQMSYDEPAVLVAPDFRLAQDAITSKFDLVWRKDVEFEVGDVVKVRGWAALRAEGRTSGNGLSLFRRGRVIIGTSEAPFRPAGVYGQSNSYRSQRLFGELGIEGLPVSHTKDGFQWQGLEDEFESRLREALDAEPLALLRQAEGYRARQASRTEQRRVEQAAQNTAEVSAREIPPVIRAGPPETVPAQESSPLTAADLDVAQEFEFRHSGALWRIQISSTSRPAERRWLIRNVEPMTTNGQMLSTITINTSHPFISQFALGSVDALESIFRLAVAITVSESLAHLEGDGETVARYLRQVDQVLTEALSRRLRSAL
ncbi:ATP-binding protein [Jatrophihabitans fulvus]